MKKLLMSLGVTAVLFLACTVNWSDLSMPEQVAIETTPALYLPLTRNLFSGEFEQYSPEKLIDENLSPSKIKEMLGENMSGIAVSAYEDPANPDAPLTYLWRYPLAEMPYDLSEYMVNLEVEAPSITLDIGGDLPEGIPKDLLPKSGDPLPNPIPFDPIETNIHDMANLVSSLTYNKLGVRIKGDFAGALEVHITDGNAVANGGFELISTGAYDDSKGYTEFATSGVWKPSKHHQTLTIAMTLTHYPDAVGDDGKLTVAPEFVLDWEEATVYPGDTGKLEGYLSLDFSEDLGETLKGITFPDDSIKAYLYISGLPPADVRTTLTSTFSDETGGDKTISLVEDQPLAGDAVAPELPSDDSPYEEAIPPSSLADADNPDGAIDLTGPLNASLNGKGRLNYIVEMKSIDLERKNLISGKISAVLLIKLPLALRYSGAPFESNAKYHKNDSESPSELVDNSDYLKFEMDGLDFSGMFGDDDLLEPIKERIDSGGVSGQLVLKDISLILTNCDITLLPGVRIAIKQNKDALTGTLIDFSSPDPSGDIPITLKIDANAPFTPSIDILLRKDASGDFATLSLKKDGRFRFGLIVEIESALDATVTL
ncbi:MAG: hypothetical protein LBG43_00940 [Treponema sp.]|jgi:hypothetical protein|nr:hypothetical protein [Treponema sp.]